MRLAVNKVLRIKDLIPGKGLEPLQYTIVEVRETKVVLCLQDYDRPKKPFLHTIGEPLKYKAYTSTGDPVTDTIPWSKIEIINNNFENDPAKIWFEKLKLAQGKQNYDYIKQLETYEKAKADADKKLEIIKAFEYQCDWSLDSLNRLKFGVQANFDLQQKKDNRYLYITKQISKKALIAFASNFEKLSTAKLRRILGRYYAFGQSFESCIGRYHIASERNYAIRPEDN